MKKLLVLSIALLIGFFANAQTEPKRAINVIPYTVSGTNTYTVTFTGMSLIKAGDEFRFTFTNANTSTATINGTALVKNPSTPLASGDIAAGGTYMVRYTGTVYQLLIAGSGGGGNYTGNSPTTVTVGGLSSGSNISNLPISDVIQSIVAPYINPVFTSFSVSGQSQTVEATTTLSGARTFTWSIAANSGVVPTVTIYDNTTASDLLAGTPNDGSQSITITTIKLSTNGQTQSWRAIGNNTSPTSTFTSGNFDVTARFYLWHGAVSTVPTTSAGIRALPSNQFYVGGTTFTLNTGTLKDFMVALPIGRAITNVIDLDALNANITGQYVLQTPIAVVLADGTTTSTYSIYKNTIASAYSSNHRHQITIN